MCFLTSLFYYGAFTLPDTETDTETQIGRETEKLAQNVMGICIGTCLCAV